MPYLAFHQYLIHPISILPAPRRIRIQLAFLCAHDFLAPAFVPRAFTYMDPDALLDQTMEFLCV